MHADEVPADAGLVRHLLARQFPQWADLPVDRVASSGTDHHVFRLGDGLAARLPRIGWAVQQAATEARWLPRLRPLLPLAVPVPVALGHPDAGYPFPWAVHEWLPGRPAQDGALEDDAGAAEALAAFVRALRGLDPEGAPVRSPGGRGAPLQELDDGVRSSLGQLGRRADGPVDTRALLRAWQESLDAPDWPGPAVWLHGDLLPGNLLVVEGRLAAVIDWGALTTGDPAVDLLPAWNLFDGAAREVFLRGADADEATRLRGRGWALAQAVVALPYYTGSNPGIVRQARHALAEVLAESR